MKARILTVFAYVLYVLAVFYAFAVQPAHSQQIDSTVRVSQFPGDSVGAKVKNAMATCGTNVVVPCILVIDPSLAAYPSGSMPTLCSHCYLADFRNGPPVGSPSTVSLPYSINITDAPYNAKCDGSSDDSAAIQAAFNSGALNIYAPLSGPTSDTQVQCNFASTLTLPANGGWEHTTAIYAQGTIFHFTGSGDAFELPINGSAIIDRMGIDMSASTPGSVIFDVHDNSYYLVCQFCNDQFGDTTTWVGAVLHDYGSEFDLWHSVWSSDINANSGQVNMYFDELWGMAVKGNLSLYMDHVAFNTGSSSSTCSICLVNPSTPNGHGFASFREVYFWNIDDGKYGLTVDSGWGEVQGSIGGVLSGDDQTGQTIESSSASSLVGKLNVCTFTSSWACSDYPAQNATFSWTGTDTQKAAAGGCSTGCYVSGTTYTNSHSYPVMEMIRADLSGSSGTGGGFQIVDTIDSKNGPSAKIGNDCNPGSIGTTFIVPPGKTFSATASQTESGCSGATFAITSWLEVPFN